MNAGPFRWWHAALIFLLVNGLNAWPAGYGGDAVFYNNFRQPAVAPPDWAFPPVWLVLNITSLVALVLIANRPSSRWRTGFLWFEGVGWFLFAIFATLFFWLKSPVLGAADTVLSLGVALGSLVCSGMLDRRAAALILLRVVWLLLASYVAVYIALLNPDPFFGGPLLSGPR